MVEGGCGVSGSNDLSQDDAQSNFLHALRLYDPDQHRDAKFRFGQDTRAGATVYLAHTSWLLGEPGRAHELVLEAVEQATASAHVPTLAQTQFFKALLDIFRGDAAGARRTAEAMIRLAREHGLPLYLS